MLVSLIGQRTPPWRRENFGSSKNSQKKDCCNMRMSKIAAHHDDLQPKYDSSTTKVSNEMIIQVGRE
jgi:hypothetical protein